MIRELRKADINKVADIWLDTNRKTHRQYLFIKEKGLKSSAMALMKLPGKEIMQWHGNGNRCHCECHK